MYLWFFLQQFHQYYLVAPPRSTVSQCGSCTIHFKKSAALSAGVPKVLHQNTITFTPPRRVAALHLAMQDEVQMPDNPVDFRSTPRRASAEKASQNISNTFKPSRGSPEYETAISLRKLLTQEAKTVAVSDLDITESMAKKLKRPLKQLENAIPYNPDLPPEEQRCDFVEAILTIARSVLTLPPPCQYLPLQCIS
jgi:hypothetical protein